MTLDRDEVLMAPYKCCCFSARSAQGWIKGGAKIGHGGPHIHETSSSDWKVSEACGMKCFYFGVHSEVKFLKRFDVFLDIFILPYFNAISIDFYALMCLIYIYFLQLPGL